MLLELQGLLELQVYQEEQVLVEIQEHPANLDNVVTEDHKDLQVQLVYKDSQEP